jgi:oxaloacetate decarboxylase beta subunit
MSGPAFIRTETLIVLGLGFLAICLDTVCGVLFAKLMNTMSREKINPLIGAAGVASHIKLTERGRILLRCFV